MKQNLHEIATKIVICLHENIFSLHDYFAQIIF